MKPDTQHEEKFSSREPSAHSRFSLSRVDFTLNRRGSCELCARHQSKSASIRQITSAFRSDPQLFHESFRVEIAMTLDTQVWTSHQLASFERALSAPLKQKTYLGPGPQRKSILRCHSQAIVS